MLHDRKPRSGAVTLEEREEIRIGVERVESYSESARPFWAALGERSVGRSLPVVGALAIGRFVGRIELMQRRGA